MTSVIILMLKFFSLVRGTKHRKDRNEKGSRKKGGGETSGQLVLEKEDVSKSIYFISQICSILQFDFCMAVSV